MKAAVAVATRDYPESLISEGDMKLKVLLPQILRICGVPVPRLGRQVYFFMVSSPLSLNLT